MANIFYNKTKLKNIRRVLRKQIISAEVIFWSKIRNKQQQYKFRRQYSVGNYVLDFYCPKLKLGVEIDGATHTTDQEINKDLKREQDIKLFGIKIIRFNNTDI